MAYASDPVGARAAIAAGYSARSSRSTAARLLTNANLLARVEELRAAAAEAHGLTRDSILQGLHDEATRERKDGGTHHGRIAAWVALAKMLGFDAPPAAAGETVINVRRVGIEEPVSRIVIVNSPASEVASNG